MKKIIIFLLALAIVPLAVARADDLVSISSDDIHFIEPAFTDFVKQKYPFLVTKLDNLAKTTDPLHLNVDFNNFDEFWISVKQYYSLQNDLSSNIKEYTSEAKQKREKIFAEHDLKSPSAIQLILDYKFLKKNIDHSKTSIDALTRDFQMLFIVLKNKPIEAEVREVTDLRTYAAAMTHNIFELKNKKITTKEFSKASKSFFIPIEKIEHAQHLRDQFLTISADITGKGRFMAKIGGTCSGIFNTAQKIYSFELYIVENKKVTLGSILNIVFVIFILVAAYRLFQKLIASKIDTGRGPWHAFNILSKYVVILTVSLVILFGLGLDLAKVTLLVSAVSVGIGFGLQKIFSNLVSGIILLFDKSIKLGDTLQVGDIYGTVTSMNARFASVLSYDGREHLIPNESLITDNVVNLTYSAPQFRLSIPVGISYGSDVPLAMRLMEQAVREVPRVLSDPAPEACLRGFGDSSVDFELLVWIADPENGLVNVQSDVLVAVWKIFKENNIVIPFPQQDIYVKSLPENFSSPGGK